MEKILKIEEKTFKCEDDWTICYDGFVINTDKQVIKLGIEFEQNCCEKWGYFMSEDNLEEFIGAYLISVKVTDTALKTWDVLKEIVDNYEGHVMFVNLETSKGLLQFVAYNEHNGYYGHEACIVSKQVNRRVTL